MTEIRKMKIEEFGAFILLIICIILLYKLYTIPVGLYGVIDNKDIKSVELYVNFNDFEGLEESSIKVDKKQDIDEFISILNRYKYSKIPRLYIDGVYPASTNDLIGSTISYSGNIISHQLLSVDSSNEVSISYGNGKYRDYRVKGNEGKLFEELLYWVNDYD